MHDAAVLLEPVAPRSASRKICRPRVTRKQWQFLQLDTRFSAFIGGRGSGKTVAGTLRAVECAGRERCTGVVISPTYGNLEDINLPKFLEVCEPGGIVSGVNRSRHTVALANGSIVHFRSADKPDFMRGLSVSWAWLDEAAMLDEYTWRVILPALREYGRPGRAWITTTPRGKNWIWSRFAPQPDETPEQAARRRRKYGLVHAHTRDNAFLAPDIVSDLEADYGVGWFARQELNGEFCDPEGSLFQRDWLRIVDRAPEFARTYRGWDLAVSTKSSADYTAGVRIGITAEQDVYVLDVQRYRAEWPDSRRRVIATADGDGERCTIGVESVAFQLAAVQELRREPAMSRYALREVKAERDKLSYALPLASKAQAGKVYLLRGAWNAAYIDELCMFSGDGKGNDDQVDGTTIAYRCATRPEVRMRVLE
jgi:predicted phage terminase large subunit-like protein